MMNEHLKSSKKSIVYNKTVIQFLSLSLAEMRNDILLIFNIWERMIFLNYMCLAHHYRLLDWQN